MQSHSASSRRQQYGPLCYSSPAQPAQCQGCLQWEAAGSGSGPAPHLHTSRRRASSWPSRANRLAGGLPALCPAPGATCRRCIQGTATAALSGDAGGCTGAVRGRAMMTLSRAPPSPGCTAPAAATLFASGTAGAAAAAVAIPPWLVSVAAAETCWPEWPGELRPLPGPGSGVGTPRTAKFAAGRGSRDAGGGGPVCVAQAAR
jgi:hypothetical protein